MLDDSVLGCSDEILCEHVENVDFGGDEYMLMSEG